MTQTIENKLQARNWQQLDNSISDCVDRPVFSNATGQFFNNKVFFVRVAIRDQLFNNLFNQRWP